MIAVVPRYPEKDSRIGGPPMLYGQRLAWDLLREAGGNRFALFDLENADGTPIYVHAKVCVVDDQWMTIGSDNLNRRSWTHDSELTCAVVDPSRVLPRQTRTSLWAEHLGLPQDEPRLSDLSSAVTLWAERGGRPRQPHPPSRPAGPAGLDAAVGATGLPCPLRPRRPAPAAARDDGLLTQAAPASIGQTSPASHRRVPCTCHSRRQESVRAIEAGWCVTGRA